MEDLEGLDGLGLKGFDGYRMALNGFEWAWTFFLVGLRFFRSLFLVLNGLGFERGLAGSNGSEPVLKG